MKITTKELRIQLDKIIEQTANGEEITVTFRGKPLVKIIPFDKKPKAAEKEDISIFGLWKDHEDSANGEDYVRMLRKGRQF